MKLPVVSPSSENRAKGLALVTHRGLPRSCGLPKRAPDGRSIELGPSRHSASYVKHLRRRSGASLSSRSRTVSMLLLDEGGRIHIPIARPDTAPFVLVLKPSRTAAASGYSHNSQSPAGDSRGSGASSSLRLVLVGCVEDGRWRPALVSSMRAKTTRAVGVGCDE